MSERRQQVYNIYIIGYLTWTEARTLLHTLSLDTWNVTNICFRQIHGPQAHQVHRVQSLRAICSASV